MSLSLKPFYSTLGSWSCPTIDCWHTQLCMVFPITFEAGITKNRCFNESVNFSKSHCCHTPSSRAKSDRIWGNLSCALFTYPLIVSYFPIASSDSRASAVFYRTHEYLLHFHHEQLVRPDYVHLLTLPFVKMFFDLVWPFVLKDNSPTSKYTSNIPFKQENLITDGKSLLPISAPNWFQNLIQSIWVQVFDMSSLKFSEVLRWWLMNFYHPFALLKKKTTQFMRT